MLKFEHYNRQEESVPAKIYIKICVMFMHFVIGGILVINELFDVFNVKKPYFFSRVFCQSISNETTLISIIVFVTFFYSIFILLMPMDNYYVFMNANSNGSGFNNINSSTMLNQTPFGPNNHAMSLDFILNNDGIAGRLAYCKYNNGHYIRLKGDDGEMITRLNWRELPGCTVRNIRISGVSGTVPALNLLNCEGKEWHKTTTMEGFLLPIKIK